MFAALTKPTFDVAGIGVGSLDVAAVGLIAFTGVRYYKTITSLWETKDAQLYNARIPIENEAQQAFNWALGIGAALVVVPRVIKAVM
jgi:hypothetical protein